MLCYDLKPSLDVLVLEVPERGSGAGQGQLPIPGLRLEGATVICGWLPLRLGLEALGEAMLESEASCHWCHVSDL